MLPAATPSVPGPIIRRICAVRGRLKSRPAGSGILRGAAPATGSRSARGRRAACRWRSPGSAASPRRHQRHERDRAEDRRHVEHRRRQRRDEEPAQRVQHPHHRDGDGHDGQERQHDAVSVVVSSSLPGTSANLGAMSVGDRPAKTIPEHDEMPVMTSSALMTLRRAARRLLRPLRQLAGERGHERRRHRALGEQVAQQVGNPEGDVVGVHRSAGAEVGGEHAFAGDAEDPAGQGGDADEARGTGRRELIEGLQRTACHTRPRRGACRTVRFRKF